MQYVCHPISIDSSGKPHTVLLNCFTACSSSSLIVLYHVHYMLKNSINLCYTRCNSEPLFIYHTISPTSTFGNGSQKEMISYDNVYDCSIMSKTHFPLF